MTEANPVLDAMDRAAAALSEAASELTLVMLAAGHTPLGNDAYVLANAVDAELAAVITTRRRHTPERITPADVRLQCTSSEAASRDAAPHGARRSIGTGPVRRFVATIVHVRRGRLDG